MADSEQSLPPFHFVRRVRVTKESQGNKRERKNIEDQERGDGTAEKCRENR
jgi:hypothetical protein